METNRKTFVLGFATGAVVGMAVVVAAVHFGLVPESGESPAVLHTRVLRMTPEQFPKRCGTLVGDKLAPSEFDLGSLTRPRGQAAPLNRREVTVAMTLPGGEKANVTAVFVNVSLEDGTPEWKLSSVGGYDQMSGPLGGLNMIEELYSCTTQP